MKRKLLIVLVLIGVLFQAKSQQSGSADFRWGNGFYYNLNVGESVIFNQMEVKLLKVENHYNQLKIGSDTLWLKVARRSVPEQLGGVRIFAADNKNVKSLATEPLVHGLLTKDALVCLSDPHLPLLDPDKYIFPVSFNDGFVWSADEESSMYAFYQNDESGKNRRFENFTGFGFDLNDARGIPKHWLVAIEDCRVVWVKTEERAGSPGYSCVLLESASQPGIYYSYNRLYPPNVAVKKGQKLVRGETIGTAWGDADWGYFQFAVARHDNEPTPEQFLHHAVNSFPQLFELYFQRSGIGLRSFSRGQIQFGKPRRTNGNRKNSMAFEPYSGKGWLLGKWNPADRVEWVSARKDGNVRLKKVLFEGTTAQCEIPHDFFEYQIVAPNGTYRIRAKVGDLYLPTWQKLEFEGIASPVKKLDAGETDWTGERVVKVKDGTINVRIYLHEDGEIAAALSEIVFQRAY